METRFEDVTGVVLMGGKSRRMGSDKALLRVGGRPMIEITIGALAGVTPRILLVGSPVERFAHLGLPAIPDIRPGGALGGLYTGLHEAGTEYVFAVACDMPFPSSALIRHLLSLRKGWDVVVPRRGGRLEPLFAVYSRACLPPMERLLEAGDLRIRRFFPEVRTLIVGGEDLRHLEAAGDSFVNVNTPEEYQGILKGRKEPS